jgi:hypothetical protein
MPDPEQSSLTVTVNIIPDMAAASLAVEFRKIRDAVNMAYRNALIENKLPVYHPIMQSMCMAAIQCEGVAQALDPPRVVAPGMDQAIRGLERA